MKDAHFYIYNVGHGVCTLLTGKKDNDEPYCGVFDCGTKAEHPECSLDKVINDMKRKILNNGNLEINDVVISHQDKDHWNKFMDLFFKLNGINGNYYFGKKGHQAWHLTKNYIKPQEVLLYRLGKALYQVNGYADDYSYMATFMHEEDVISTFSVRAFDTNDIKPASCKSGVYSVDVSEGKYTFQLEYLTLTLHGYRRDYAIFTVEEKETAPITMESLVKKINQEINKLGKLLRIDARVLGPLRSALDSVKDLFAEKNWSSFRYGINNCEELSFFINRVVMGGGLITKKYARFKDLLFYMVQYYKDFKNFSWQKDGAFIFIDESNITRCARVFVPYRFFPESIIRNSTSAIVVLKFDADNRLLLPGDVTVHAFKDMAVQVRLIPSGTLKLFLAPHHGSDDTNFLKIQNEPLNHLINAILGVNAECNFVVSGYNAVNDHPGQKFTECITKCITAATGEQHDYAWANNEDGYIDAPGVVAITPNIIDKDEMKWLYYVKTKKRLFTTNLLGGHYFELENKDGKYEIEYSGIFLSVSPCNSKHILPPDDCFI